MANLLKLELKELLRQFIFRFLLLLCPILGVLLGMMNDADGHPISEGLTQWCAIMAVMLSTYGGLSISREFTRNTIRNKVVVGHRRRHIYSAKLATVGMIYLMCLSLLLLSNYLTGLAFTGKISVDWKQILLIYANAALCGSITAAITTILRSDFGALIPLLFLYLSIIFSGLGYEFLSKDLMDALNLFLPCGQLMVDNPEKALLGAGCAALEAILLAIGGYRIFRKADLN